MAEKCGLGSPMFNQVHTFANEKAARDFADSMLRAYPVQGYSTLTRVYREGM
jgi:hypothetical protein